MRDQVRIGTSGWVYNHWRGAFYPNDLPQKKWFEYYAKHFDTVEINYTFYQLPPAEYFQSWRKQAPREFLYAVKSNRYITHMKKLKESEEAVENFLSRTRLLGEHLGPILWQLPPNWNANPNRLAAFAKLIPEDLEHAFEFRDPNWFNDEIKGILEENGLSFVIFAMPELDCPQWVTSDLIYIRFHGSREKYVGRYGRDGLKPWAKRIQDWSESGHNVYIFFNNDEHCNATKDAQTLHKLLES
jgi:uncharacterized protein YecE (DUF72 family)